MKKENMVSAAHIALLRQKRGITQPQLAAVVSEMTKREMPYTPAIVSAWETGRRAPSIQAAQAMSALFDVSTEYILGQTNAMNETSADMQTNAISQSRIAYDDLSMYHNMPVYVVFPNKEHENTWGLLDASSNDGYKIKTLKYELSITKKSDVQIYPREIDYADANSLKRKNKLGMIQIMESTKPVYVQMITVDAEVRAVYDGWYRVTNNQRFLQNEEGQVLPLSGLNRTYNVYSEI